MSRSYPARRAGRLPEACESLTGTIANASFRVSDEQVAAVATVFNVIARNANALDFELASPVLGRLAERSILVPTCAG